MTQAAFANDDVLRAPVSPAALELLQRSDAELARAVRELTSDQRFIHSHIAALRAAAAVVAVRGRPAVRRSQPLSVWEVLTRVCPELGEWAAYFASLGQVRAGLEAGRTHLVGPRQADDLLRAAQDFSLVVRRVLRVATQPVLPNVYPACTR